MIIFNDNYVFGHFQNLKRPAPAQEGGASKNPKPAEEPEESALPSSGSWADVVDAGRQEVLTLKAFGLSQDGTRRVKITESDWNTQLRAIFTKAVQAACEKYKEAKTSNPPPAELPPRPRFYSTKVILRALATIFMLTLKQIRIYIQIVMLFQQYDW